MRGSQNRGKISNSGYRNVRASINSLISQVECVSLAAVQFDCAALFLKIILFKKLTKLPILLVI